MRKKGAIVIIIICIALGLWFFRDKPKTENLGGALDQSGCLVGGGYTYNEDIGACVAMYELTPDIIKAAKIAVEKVGNSKGLTVVSFNSYEEVGSYDIILNHGSSNAAQTIEIRNWKVATKEQIEETNVKSYLRDNISQISPTKATLGGMWHVVSSTVDTGAKTGTVVYEDGHMQEKRNFTYTVDKDELVNSLIIK